MGGGASYGKSKSESGMPKEMRAIIKEGWEEMGDLREMLIGTFMGVMSGSNKMFEQQTVGATPGYYKEVSETPTGAVDDEGMPIMRPGGREWVPGQPGREEWVEGGEGMQIPIIAQAQEAQRRATSQALTGSQESLAQKGLAGTPFGEMIMAQQRQQGASAVQGIPTQFAQQLLSIIPGYTQGSASSIMGALPGTRESDAKAWNAMAQGGVGG
ncbi:MAG: hypothetical protein ACXABY_15685 [Candidatus Thorarchaeota archaeon]|jgi:hypothetical protein